MTEWLITSARDLVSELWGNAPYGNVWVKEQGKRTPTSVWFAISGETGGRALPFSRFDAETARLAQRVGADVYFGVHPVSAIPPGPGARSQLAVIHSARGFFADFDRKDHAGIESTEALAEMIVQRTYAAPPSVMVETGGGIHAYWLLEYRVDLADAGARAEYAALQERFVHAIGADPGAKDLARVLRVPDTLNHKYSPARAVRILDGNGIRYSIDVLRRIAAPAPTIVDLAVRPAAATPVSSTPAAPVSPTPAAQPLELVAATTTGADDETRPGDYFNAHCAEIALGLLLAAGWVVDRVNPSGGKYLTRPGKDDGVSASWFVKTQGLHVFTSSAAPFESDGNYAPFAVFALLAHNGDYADAARTIRQTMMPAPNAPNTPAADRSAGSVETTPAADRSEATPPTSTPPTSTPARRKGITAAELRNKHFDPQVWVVEDIAPEGAVIIAAKPKQKKSWLALNLSLAIASGSKALGRYQTRRGDVLYLDLEGNQRRIKRRLAQMLQGPGDVWPANLTLHTEWSRDDEAIAEIRQWLTDTPTASAVVVDLLHEIRRPMKSNEDRYSYDREMLVKLNRLAEEYHVAIFVIHHTRKMKGEDVFEEISGSLGLVGAVTTSWVLSKGQDGHPTLNLQGRDLMRDDPLVLKWDPQFCTFSVIGTEAEASMSEPRRRVYDALRAGVTTPAGLIAETGMVKQAVNNQLAALLVDGLIIKASTGVYDLAAPAVRPAAVTPVSPTPAEDRSAGAGSGRETAQEALRRAEAPKPTTTPAAPEARPAAATPVSPTPAARPATPVSPTPITAPTEDRSAGAGSGRETAQEALRRAEASKPTTTPAAPAAPVPSTPAAPAPDKEQAVTPIPSKPATPATSAPSTPAAPTLTAAQRAWHEEGASTGAEHWWRRHATDERVQRADPDRHLTIRRGRSPNGREQYLVCDHACFGLLQGSSLWGYRTEDGARRAAAALVPNHVSPRVSAVPVETANWYEPAP